MLHGCVTWPIIYGERDRVRVVTMPVSSPAPRHALPCLLIAHTLHCPVCGPPACELVACHIANARTPTHTHAYLCARVRTHAHTRARARAHTHAHARTHARTRARTHAHARARTHTRAHARTRARARTRTDARAHTPSLRARVWLRAGTATVPFEYPVSTP